MRQHDGRSTPESHFQSRQGFSLGVWRRIHDLFAPHDHYEDLDEPVHRPNEVSWPDQPPPPSTRDWSTVPVGVGLPRQATFRRQNSEKRDRLEPVEPSATERRALSSARAAVSLSVSRRPRASSTPPLYHLERSSAPTVANPSGGHDQLDHKQKTFSSSDSPIKNIEPILYSNHVANDGTRPPRPSSITSSAMSHHQDLADVDVDEKTLIKAELDTKWILNLSMHFRDKSDREKFFVTYAESPNKWRRVTVSCDYRNAEPGSLEKDLKELQFQRDKSLQIYESIRDSLPEIQFYDTVTNLKLETSEGRLHVHVTEDVNETISYPPRSTVSHILHDTDYRPQEICESELNFDAHLSGFVYKVTHNDRVYIKKEIPGPDTVDEFLYEINALHALHGSQNVIQLEGIVVDDTHQLVKGLLISYAEQGAIVDLLYDYKGKIEWADRLRWAHHSVVGLSEIHDEGYVQGDFTLSNIVVDGDNNAKIIDINRRGCPVGWEPPEIAVKIASHQRISMYIGEKSDLYQLGMTLWGLAADDDEPERHDPPLSVDELPRYVPEWYKEIIRICLDPKPRNRLSARELAKMFPPSERPISRRLSDSPHPVDFREQKRYIDPSHAVERADLERLGWKGSDSPYSPESSRYDDTFTYPRSSNYDRGSDISEFERPRGRAPARNLEHLSDIERRGWPLEDTLTPQTYDDGEPQIISVSPRMEPQYDDVRIGGKPFLIARGSFNDEVLEILDSRPRGRLANNDVETEFMNPTQLPPRPHNAWTSASSTPRHSQANLPPFLGSRYSSRYATSDPGTVKFNPEHTSEDYASSSMQPLNEERSGPLLPYSPPSLSYADSGFCEAQDEDDMLPHSSMSNKAGLAAFSHQSDEATSETPLATSTSEHKTSAAKFPPPLERSDTTIRIGPEVKTSSGPAGSVPSLVVQDVDQSSPSDVKGDNESDAMPSGPKIEDTTLLADDHEVVMDIPSEVKSEGVINVNSLPPVEQPSIGYRDSEFAIHRPGKSTVDGIEPQSPAEPLAGHPDNAAGAAVDVICRPDTNV